MPGALIGGIGMELYVNTSNPVSPSTMEEAMGNLSVAKDPNGNPMSLSLTEFGVANGFSAHHRKLRLREPYHRADHDVRHTPGHHLRLLGRHRWSE